MKKFHTFFVSVFLLSGITVAQDQLENPGFEQWEDVLVSETDTIREPLEWSSLKTSDNDLLIPLAPLVCTRSSDAHSGDYSVKLTNVDAGFLVANGVVTNGRIHADLNTDLAYIFTDTLDDQWNTPLTARPDSIAGWFNYTPQGEDSLQVIVILHRGFGKQPDADSVNNWIGMAEYRSPLNTEGEWYRFSTPFIYFSDSIPEYILIILNSGNGYAPVAGSIALFDDFEMIYNSPQTSLDRLEQTEGYIYAPDYRSLVIRGMDHTRFQTIRIHDITGKLVWDGTVNSHQVDISSAHLRKGIYVITLNGKSRVFSQKIMLL